MKTLQSIWQKPFPQAMTADMFPSGLRLLVMAPHPDDFDAIGVTLKLLADNGNPLHVTVVRTASGVEDSYRPDLTPARKADLREAEQRDSARFFGLPDHALDFVALDKDAQDHLYDNAANAHALSTILADRAPDIVFLPHGNDTNHDHRVLCALMRQIAARHGRPVALFLNRDAKTTGMRTDLYLPFGDEMARWKAKLLRFHDSQQQRNLNQRGHGFDERVLALNGLTARELHIDAPYAEAFELEFYNIPV